MTEGAPRTTESLSGEAQAVLYIVGAAGAALGLWLVSVVVRVLWRAVSRVSAAAASAIPTKAAKKATPVKPTATPPAQQQNSGEAGGSAAEVKKPSISLRQAKEDARKQGGKGGKPGKHSHHLFLGTLQGHQDHVTGCAVSWDSKTVATTCEDRVLRTFALHEAVKGPKHSSNPRVKKNLAKTPTGVAFGADDDELVVSTAGLLGHADLAMYANKTGQQGRWEEAWELADCLDRKQILPGGLSSGCNDAGGPGRAQPMILMAAGGGSTELRLFSPKAGGRMLFKCDSGQMKNYMTTVSADGRFFSVGAFTAEMKIWEVKYARDGSALGVEMAMGLKGHSSQVKSVGFSSDSRRAVTASLDGTLGVWNIDVRYHLKEDAKRIIKEPLPLPQGQCYELLAVAPESSGGCIAACHGNTLHFLSLQTGKLLETVEGAHAGGVVQMVWTRRAIDTEKGLQAVLVTAGGDHTVRLWGCPTA